jgi:carboxyl-terminal processing protease
MDERKPSVRLNVWTPLIFAIVMILGMVLGFKLRDSLRNKRDITTVLERNDRLEQIIDLIKEKYVDSVNTDGLYDDAVNGITSHLDPHTVYIPATELQEVNEDLEGSFFGIGVEFSIVKDTIQVTSVVPDGPASKVNIEVGDQIIKVGDSLVAGTRITSERIIKMLRGKEHTKVLVVIHSPLSARTRNVTIERGSIPLYSLDASFMLDPSTGYIRINRFSATTYEEFVKATKNLLRKGMQNMVLDLRQNPGGYLDAATAIADDFLDGDKLIVYTEGRRAKRMDYDAGTNNLFEKGKLALLVDESSASASEILAGAIQDWDRGIIVGRRSFGKGLVQEQYDLGDGSAMRLTIAKYYTPSGRSIQRSYAKGRDAYAADFSSRYATGELTGADSVAQKDTTQYFTSNKRVVYGGGGINPDIYVPYDTTKMNTATLSIVYSEGFRNAALGYYLKNQQALKKFASMQEFIQGFHADDMSNAVLASLPDEIKPTVTKMMQKPAVRSFLELRMKAQLARVLFKNDGYYAVLATDDDVIRKALQAIESPQYSQAINR